ncbi:MAG: DUF4293 domain-containing protein [Bacteroidota bacterium]
MIQRVQSIYLVLVKIFAIMFLFLPLGRISVEANIFNLNIIGYGLYEHIELPSIAMWMRYIIIATTIIVLILSVITFFKYKNRPLQIKLNQFNLLLHILIIALSFFFLDYFQDIVELEFRYSIAVIFPLLSLIFLLLANKAIKKDEKLVKAADRLR